MNCGRCHHSDEAHEEGPSMTGSGRCSLPGCTCRVFEEPFAALDEM
ncbi:MAG: hypothetical protein MPI95_05325 [Nitrosopumilus sp.]|nr:hypothetical protein [Nitrosopumilus sp.]CAI9831166.1 conserved hypothetical protein [Nitrosopumilaceae archaeon]MDA7941589.1 hypothetical protein [Nitrosopumilus sp.]MDA7943849.1 hypothetical protein [Nitrosopumilus sp.]MDA7945227.1 hypothetical protein [Nitrosopumilus sp.]